MPNLTIQYTGPARITMNYTSAQSKEDRDEIYDIINDNISDRVSRIYGDGDSDTWEVQYSSKQEAERNYREILDLIKNK